MSNEADKDRTKTDGSPESTWGATEEAKGAWDRKHGGATRKAAKEREDEKNAEK